MPRASTIRLSLCLVLLIPLAACTLGTPKQAATPAPPKPAVVPQPVPEPPLSIPQTVVSLPSPQPVNPDAIPPVVVEAPPPPKEVETAQPAKPTRRGGAPAKADSETVQTATPPTPTEGATEAAPFQAILSSDEQKRLQGSIEARRHEIDSLLARGRAHRQNKPMIERITSFLNLSGQAAQRGDYTQADALSERALILAKELQVE
jgi:hypothetical protein